jgi:hypothetical protein
MAYYIANIIEGTISYAGDTAPHLPSHMAELSAVEIDSTPTEAQTLDIINWLRSKKLGAARPTISEEQQLEANNTRLAHEAILKYTQANGTVVGLAESVGASDDVIQALVTKRPLTSTALEEFVGKLRHSGIVD